MLTTGTIEVCESLSDTMKMEKQQQHRANSVQNDFDGNLTLILSINMTFVINQKFRVCCCYSRLFAYTDSIVERGLDLE